MSAGRRGVFRKFMPARPKRRTAPDPVGEIFDVVDDADRVIGQAPRTEVHACGLKHRAIHVWVFNPAGELFVQKRGRDKDTFPGCYDSSASGHLGHGEDYGAAAVRELREELGLELSRRSLRRHWKLPASAVTGKEFVWVYSVQGDYRPVINRAEIAAGGFWSRRRLETLLREHPERCAPSFRFVCREFGRREQWPGPARPARGTRCQARSFHV